MQISKNNPLQVATLLIASTATNSNNLYARWVSSGTIDVGLTELAWWLVQEDIEITTIQVKPTTNTKDGTTTLRLYKSGVVTSVITAFAAGTTGITTTPVPSPGVSVLKNQYLSLNLDTSASTVGNFGCMVWIYYRRKV